jgi:phage terminase small subunit
VTEILGQREQSHAQSTAKAIERAALTKEWIIAKLIDNAERALQAQQARDDAGNPVGDFKYEGSVANRALELLGKELGMFIDRKVVQNVDEFDDISDPLELRQRLVERAEEIGQRDIASALVADEGEAGSSGRLN